MDPLLISRSGSNLVPDTDTLRRGGTGCANPGLGCYRTEYATSAAPGYLRPGYDDGRWWAKPGGQVR